MQLNQMEIPGKNRGLERKSKSRKRNVKYLMVHGPPEACLNIDSNHTQIYSLA